MQLLMLTLEVKKSLHTLFDKYAGEIWTKLYGPNYKKSWDFWRKNGFLKTIFDKALTPFWKTFP